MSDPSRKTNFSRNCWIEFDNDEHCRKAEQTLSGVMIKNDTLNVSKAYTKMKRIRILKNYPSTRLKTDIEIISRLITKLDASLGIENNVLLNRKYQTLHKNLKFHFHVIPKLGPMTIVISSYRPDIFNLLTQPT